MPNQNAIDYLQKNKNAFPKETLISELSKAGYESKDIEDAAKIVFGDQGQIQIPKTSGKTGFWQFNLKREYASTGQKIGDFLFGFFIIPLINIIPLIGIIGEIVLIVYLFKRRKWISIGTLSGILASIILILLIFGFSFSTAYNNLPS